MPYLFNEDIAVADSAVQVWGNTPEELFRESALCTSEVMVDISTVEPKVKIEINFENENIEILLYDFLSEIVYMKDAKLMFFNKYDVSIKKDNDIIKLLCFAYGENINRDKHNLRSDVKAVTLYRFKIYQKDNLWYADFVLDI
jgi:SHS2 domain-containing protein